MKKSGGCCSDREEEMVETVIWPRVDEDKQEKWTIVLSAILPQVADLKRLYQTWECLTWLQKKKLESRILKSANVELDSNVRRNFRLSQYLIVTFYKWSMIQEQLGAPGCEVDISCLSGRCEKDLLSMIFITEEIMEAILTEKVNRRSQSKLIKQDGHEVVAEESRMASGNGNSRKVDSTCGLDISGSHVHHIVHDLDAGGDSANGIGSESVVIPIHTLTEELDQSDSDDITVSLTASSSNCSCTCSDASGILEKEPLSEDEFSSVSGDETDAVYSVGNYTNSAVSADYHSIVENSSTTKNNTSCGFEYSADTSVQNKND